MKIPAYIEIRDKAGKRTALLSPKADGLKNVYVENRLNGESAIEFMLPVTSEKINCAKSYCDRWYRSR